MAVIPRARINKNFCISDLIQERVSYIDTLQILLPKGLTSRKLSKVGRLSGREPRYFRTHWPMWPRRLLLQQPTKELLEYLQTLPHAINRFEIALDLITDDLEAAEEVGNWINHHLVQKWRGKRVTRRIGHTNYWATTGQTWTSRNFATYADRASKATGAPCAHVELRIRGRSPCRAFGMESAADVLDALAGTLGPPVEEPKVADFLAPAAPEPDQRALAAAREAVQELLGPTPVPVDELIRECHVSPAIVHMALLELELAGRLERHPGNRVALIAGSSAAAS
ncbi:MAG: hypothetical protein IID48_11945 [Proteobacteria bacterium]|nr:hypothetical protein [Pseudomonadota bacterium]